MLRKVEEKVHTIRSELPIYVKVMTAANIYRIGMRSCEMDFCKYGSMSPGPGQETSSPPSDGWEEGTVEHHIGRSEQQSEGDSHGLEGIRPAERPGGGRHLPLQTGRPRQEDSQDDGLSDPQVGD